MYVNNFAFFLLSSSSSSDVVLHLERVFRVSGDDVWSETRRRFSSGDGGLDDGDLPSLRARDWSWTHLPHSGTCMSEELRPAPVQYYLEENLYAPYNTMSMIRCRLRLFHTFLYFRDGYV